MDQSIQRALTNVIQNIQVGDFVPSSLIGTIESLIPPPPKEKQKQPTGYYFPEEKEPEEEQPIVDLPSPTISNTLTFFDFVMDFNPDDGIIRMYFKDQKNLDNITTSLAELGIDYAPEFKTIKDKFPCLTTSADFLFYFNKKYVLIEDDEAFGVCLDELPEIYQRDGYVPSELINEYTYYYNNDYVYVLYTMFLQLIKNNILSLPMKYKKFTTFLYFDQIFETGKCTYLCSKQSDNSKSQSLFKINLNMNGFDIECTFGIDAHINLPVEYTKGRRLSKKSITEMYINTFMRPLFFRII